MPETSPASSAPDAQNEPIICQYTWDEYLELISRFHNYPAPGLIVGGFMVDLAKRHLPEGTLFEAVSEASSCLPDAIQLLTPCTAGNGWMRVQDLARYALSLYDKHTGEGVRVFLDVARLDAWPEIRDWYLKRTSKKEQDADRLRADMRRAGTSILGMQRITIRPEYLGKKSKGPIRVCPLCGEAYPVAHGAICRGCQGEAPAVIHGAPEAATLSDAPPLRSVPVAEAVGKTALHDMTRIEPGSSKGPAFKAGQTFGAGDLCRLQQMGRMNVHVAEDADIGPEWVHEDQAGRLLAEALCKDSGLVPAGPPREGKINLQAERPGLFVVDETALEALNLVPDICCGALHAFTRVAQGKTVAAVRAIPLYISRANLQKALTVIERARPFRVAPVRAARAGLLITGTEVFQGIIQDRFAPTLTPKIEALGGQVVKTLIRPDDAAAIASGVRELLDAGADLIVTTAGLSVDPDDVTRKALAEAGVSDSLYGTPVLPGAMSLIARIPTERGDVPVIGVPACALFFKTTAFDLILPRVLAGIPITRRDLARMGHGGLCQECPECKYPHCPFGK